MIQPIFPINLIQYHQQFPDENSCRAYLERLKWPDGFRCSRCGHKHGYRLKTRTLIECAGCGYQESLTAGTVMDNSKKPLQFWFLAIFLMMSSKGGIAAKELQRKLGLGSYQTAWTWLHKLRGLVSQQGKAPLHGLVEVDEAYVGGEREGARGRQRENKALIGVAVENRGQRIGRIRLEVVTDAGGESLKDFVERRISAGSMVHTDGWHGYKGLTGKGYIHWREVISHSDKKATNVFSHVHLVISLLKRWILGTHQGGTSKKHLQKYLDEFVFRFNRRRAKAEGYNFFQLLVLGAKVKAMPYRMIVDTIQEAA
jgi:transposase-like protein